MHAALSPVNLAAVVGHKACDFIDPQSQGERVDVLPAPLLRFLNLFNKKKKYHSRVFLCSLKHVCRGTLIV